jgi:hypothetical protein
VRVLLLDSSDATAFVLLPPRRHWHLDERAPRRRRRRARGDSLTAATTAPTAEEVEVYAVARRDTRVRAAWLPLGALRGLLPHAGARRAALAVAGGRLARHLGAFLAPADAALLLPLLR